MRYFSLLVLLLSFAGCASNGDGVNRGYVISQAQVDPEEGTPCEE